MKIKTEIAPRFTIMVSWEEVSILVEGLETIMNREDFSMDSSEPSQRLALCANLHARIMKSVNNVKEAADVCA